MVALLTISLILTIAGILVSAYAFKKDALWQGIYGHIVFYLYFLAISALTFALFAGLIGFRWKVLIFVSFTLVLAGRILTFMRLFRQLTYLHLLGGIIMFVWIIINLLVSP